MSTISPNMGLVIASVGETSAPTWAEQINSSMSIIDQHNHSSGSGVPVTQDGISLTSSVSPYDSLAFNVTNAFGLRSVRFTAQAAALATASDLNCAYTAGVDLYYNDGNGNQIRLTQGGSIVGTAGSITGLPSGTASAAYSGGTFVWQSATNTAANMDAGSYILRNATAGSYGLTLQPPNAMAANYSVTLPALPGSTSIMRLDSSGNMSANLVVDNSTIEISSNTLQVKAGGIGTTQLADGGVTKPKQSAVGQQVSSSSVSYSTSSTSFTAVTNLSVSLTTTGRPVMVFLVGDASNPSYVSLNSTTTSSPYGQVRFLRDVTDIGFYEVGITAANGGGPKTNIETPSSGFSAFDAPAAGTYTYSVQVKVLASSTTILVASTKLVAYEL